MKKYILLFLLIFLVKLLSAVFLKSYTFEQNPSLSISFLAVKGGDTESYLNPFKSLIEEGAYYSETDAGKVYAGRMPIYGIPYYVLSSVLSENDRFEFYVLLQLFMESLAILMLAFTVKRYYWKSNLGLVVTILFMLLSLYATSTAIYILPESLGLSILIVIICLYKNYQRTREMKRLFLISFLLAMLIGLKPYFGILVCFFSIDIMGYYFRANRGVKPIQTIGALSVLSSFIILLIVPWTIRNFVKTDKIIPLTEFHADSFIPNSVSELRFLIADFGESSEHWDKKAMGSYFYSYPGSIYSVNDIPIANGYNSDSIASLQQYFTGLDKSNFSESKDEIITKRIASMRSSFKKENTLYCAFISPVKRIYKFTFHSGSYYLPYGFTGANMFEKMVKALQTIFYFTFLIGGFIGLIWKRELLLISIPIFLIVLFVFVLRAIELRFFTYAYPSLIIGLMCLGESIYVKKNPIRSNKESDTVNA